MGIHCLLPFLRKFKSVYGPTRLLSFLFNEFEFSEATDEIQEESKLQKLHKWQQFHSQPMAGS